jgi:diadenosine tetraphosphate (Ap4A) HIT family hydrolase
MLSTDEISNIRTKLIEQINSTFQEDKKQDALKQIESIQNEQFEDFLKQNNLIQGENQKCIFCSIIEEKMPTNKFAESEHAIATLDINPISKGHSIIIPKIHSKDAPKEAFDLATIIEKRIKKIFKPQKIDISTATIFDHEIINILPVYEGETMESEKKKVTQEELQEIQKQLIDFEDKKTPEPEEKIEELKKKEIISDKTHWLPKRIP